MLTDDELRRLADLPAAGYATERSIARELLAAREKLARIQALNELTREGQERGEYDYDSAASKDHGEAQIIPYIPPAVPIVRQPKRPSFAEALETAAATHRDRGPLADIQPIAWRDFVLLVSIARAASGE